MRLVAHEITQEIILVSDDDTGFLAAPEDTMVFQCSEEKMLKIALVLDLDLSQMPSIIFTPAKIKLTKRKLFCSQLLERYELENISIDIPTNANLANAQSFAVLKTFAGSGAVETIRDALVMNQGTEMFPVCEPYETELERKQSFIDELNNYLDNE